MVSAISAAPILRATTAGQLVGGHHVGAGALPALQHAGVHQRADRLAHRVAAHAEGLDELRLGGDAPADRPLTARGSAR